MLHCLSRYKNVLRQNHIIYVSTKIKITTVLSALFRKHYFRSLLVYLNGLYISLITPIDGNAYSTWKFVVTNFGSNVQTIYCKKLLHK